jgi:hypothetical protein
MDQDDFRIPEGLSPKGKRAAEAIVEMLNKHNPEGRISGGGCRAFYTPEEWRERGEQYGCDSLLVVCHDGGDAAPYFNYDYECYKLIDCMAVHLQKLGLFAEACTTWYTAVYEA